MSLFLNSIYDIMNELKTNSNFYVDKIKDGKRIVSKSVANFTSDSHAVDVDNFIDYLKGIKQDNPQFTSFSILLPMTVPIIGYQEIDLKKEKEEKEYQEYLRLKEKFDK